MRALPHNHWVCAVLLPSFPLVSRLILWCTIQRCFVEVPLPLKKPGLWSTTPLALWVTRWFSWFVLSKKEEITEGRKAGRASKTKLPPPPLPCLILRFGSANDSVIFSHCFAFSSYTYVVVTCAIILELCYYAGPVTSFLFFPWWSGRESNALARLLTLRLPSSSEPFSLSLTVLRLYP